MTDSQDAPGVDVRRPPPQQSLRSDAQARLAARIALSRGARRRRLLLTLGGALSALVLLVSGSAWALTGYINDHIKRVDAGTTGAGSTGPLNILVAGVDPRTGLTHHEEVVLHVGNDVSSNSDTLMLMHVSADRSRVTVVSIPRDSWVNIPGHGMNKINAAYGLGGAKLMVQTVEQATGMTINDYVEVDFLGFVKVIDALGGVNICLPQAVSDSYSGLSPVGRHAPRQRHHRPGVRARPAFLRHLRPGPHPGSAATAVVGPHPGHPLWAAGQPGAAVVVHQRVAVRADRGPGPERVSARGSDARHLRPRRDVHDRAAGQRDLPDPHRRTGGAVGHPGGRAAVPGAGERPEPGHARPIGPVTGGRRDAQQFTAGRFRRGLRRVTQRERGCGARPGPPAPVPAAGPRPRTPADSACPRCPGRAEPAGNNAQVGGPASVLAGRRVR